MDKKVDIDVLLGADKLTLILGGKSYEVRDVNLSVFMMKSEEDAKGDILHEQLAAILNIEKTELKDVGLRATALALKEIRNWVIATGFEEEAPATNP